MEKKDTRQRLMDLMVARIGRAELAMRLQVPSSVLDDWMNGSTRIPDGKLLKLIDLIDLTADN